MPEASPSCKLQMASGKYGAKHRDINPDGFAIYTSYAIYLRCDMCLRHENRKDLYHIALSVAKYIAQARLYIAIVKSPKASQNCKWQVAN